MYRTDDRQTTTVRPKARLDNIMEVSMDRLQLWRQDTRQGQMFGTRQTPEDEGTTRQRQMTQSKLTNTHTPGRMRHNRTEFYGHTTNSSMIRIPREGNGDSRSTTCEDGEAKKQGD